MLSDDVFLIHIFDTDDIRVFMTQVISVDYEEMVCQHPWHLDLGDSHERIVTLMRFRVGTTVSRKKGQEEEKCDSQLHVKAQK